MSSLRQLPERIYPTVLVALFIGWLILWDEPSLVLLIGYAVFGLFVVLTLVAAFKYRSQGWIAGVLFGLLLLLLPVWVMVLATLFEWWQG